MTLHQLPTIDHRRLAQWADEDRPFALIEVQPDHDSAASQWGVSAAFLAHTDFLEQISALRLRKTRPIVLYESGQGTVRAEEAADTLLNAGFCEVYRFVGPQAAFHASQHAHD